jgi:PAS domain S-box-containing protein
MDLSNDSDSAKESINRSELDTLRAAFEQFTQTSSIMEESYHRLQEQVDHLDRELSEKNIELEVAMEYLNSILDSMSDGVIAVNPDGKITTFNRAASKILKYESETIKGQSFEAVFGQLLRPESARQTRELTTQDQAQVPVTEKSALLSNASGEGMGAVMVFQDQRELEALREQIRQKDRLAAIGEMAATVAHEIRNPLGGIRGFAALLERDLEEDDPKYRLIQKILTGVKSLERVVNELLEYTRPIELTRKHVPLYDIIDSAMGYIDKGSKEISIDTSVDKDLTVSVDVHLMRQALMNVLVNAVQSIDDSGKITLNSTTSEKYIQLDIIDSGCGMETTVQEQIFSPFYTTKEKGTGLGLAAVHKTMQAHGGSIEVISQLHQGSTFTLILPLGD